MNINLTKKTRLLTKDKVCRENIDIIPSLQEKSVTANGIVVPDSGFVGLNKVTVNVPTVSANVMDNVSIPKVPKIGRLKCFEDDFKIINYKDIYATNENMGITGIWSDSGNIGQLDIINGSPYFNIFNNFVSLPAQVELVNDGDDFVYGYNCTDLSARWFNVGSQYYSQVPPVYIPPFTCKIAIYKSGEITYIEHSRQSGITFERQTYSATQQSASYHKLGIGCNMNGGLIVAAEFEYPKGDVTFSGSTTTGLQYRLGDTGNFTAIRDGLTLKQVEHVTVRNTGTTVRTLKDSDRTYTIGNGYTKTIPVSANKTILIT